MGGEGGGRQGKNIMVLQEFHQVAQLQGRGILIWILTEQ